MTAAPQPRCLYCDATTHASMHCPRVAAFEFTDAGAVEMVRQKLRQLPVPA